MPDGMKMAGKADYRRAGRLTENTSRRENKRDTRLRTCPAFYSRIALFLAVGQAMVVHVRADRTAAQTGLATRHFLAALHIALRHIAGRKRVRSAQAEGKQEGTGFLDHDSSPFIWMEEQTRLPRHPRPSPWHTSTGLPLKEKQFQ